jgi:Diguanylate cyclase, GGDEF domain
MRATDTARRLGEEGFLVLMPATSLEDACQIGERARQKRSRLTASKKIAVTVSMGAPLWKARTAAWEPLLSGPPRRATAASGGRQSCLGGRGLGWKSPRHRSLTP